MHNKLPRSLNKCHQGIAKNLIMVCTTNCAKCQACHAIQLCGAFVAGSLFAQSTGCFGLMRFLCMLISKNFMKSCSDVKSLLVLTGLADNY